MVGPRNGIAHSFVHSNPSINETINSFLKVRVKSIPFTHFRLTHAALSASHSRSSLSLSLPRISLLLASLSHLSLFFFCLSPSSVGSQTLASSTPQISISSMSDASQGFTLPFATILEFKII